MLGCGGGGRGGGGMGLAIAVELQLRGSLAAAASASARSESGSGTGYSSERGFCELCMHTIHQVQYGSLPSCAQSTKSFGSCSQTVQVILGQAASVLQLIEEGCYQYDSYKDWQTIKPCPSHAICGRLHNNFDVDLATLCPKDFHFRFPTALGQVSRCSGAGRGGWCVRASGCIARDTMAAFIGLASRHFPWPVRSLAVVHCFQ